MRGVAGSILGGDIIIFIVHFPLVSLLYSSADPLQLNASMTIHLL